MRRNGFTLIEFLVVVAVISIVAAFGVLAFIEYTNAAKVSTTKQIKSQTIEYAKAEMVQCKLGSETAMNVCLPCNPTSSNTPYKSFRGSTSHLYALMVMRCLTDEKGVFKDVKNPYNKSLPAIRSRSNYEVGQVSISVIDSNLQIKTCYRRGCAPADTSLVLVPTIN